MKLIYNNAIILNTHKLSEDKWIKILKEQYDISKKFEWESCIRIWKEYYIRIYYDKYCKNWKRTTYLNLPKNTFLLSERTIEDIIWILYKENFIL